MHVRPALGRVNANPGKGLFFMSDGDSTMNWRNIISFPLGDRLPKPRNQGLTMVIDKGMGLIETKDILHVNGGFIDIYKLGFGTSALYMPDILEEKIHLVRSMGVDIYPGGTFFDVA